MSACPKCGNEADNIERGRVKRMQAIPARIIHQCSACGCIWYSRDLETDPKEADVTDQTRT